MSERSRAGAWRRGPPFPAGHVAGARRCRGSGGGGSGSRSRSRSCSAAAPSPGAPGTAPGQQRGETRPAPAAPGAASRPQGAHPQRGPRSRAAGASPQACLGGNRLLLQRWEHVLPAGLREEGISSCPGCWRELVFSCLNRDSLPGQENPMPGWGGWDLCPVLPGRGHPEGACEREGSAVGREAGPVLPGGALEVPWDAEGRAGPLAWVRTGMLSLECCKGDTSSTRCREDAGPGSFWKTGSRDWVPSCLSSCAGSLGGWVRRQWQEVVSCLGRIPCPGSSLGVGLTWPEGSPVCWILAVWDRLLARLC